MKLKKERYSYYIRNKIKKRYLDTCIFYNNDVYKDLSISYTHLWFLNDLRQVFLLESLDVPKKWPYAYIFFLLCTGYSVDEAWQFFYFLYFRRYLFWNSSRNITIFLLAYTKGFQLDNYIIRARKDFMELKFDLVDSQCIDNIIISYLIKGIYPLFLLACQPILDLDLSVTLNRVDEESLVSTKCNSPLLESKKLELEMDYNIDHDLYRNDPLWDNSDEHSEKLIKDKEESHLENAIQDDYFLCSLDELETIQLKFEIANPNKKVNNAKLKCGDYDYGSLISWLSSDSMNIVSDYKHVNFYTTVSELSMCTMPKDKKYLKEQILILRPFDINVEKIN